MIQRTRAYGAEILQRYGAQILPYVKTKSHFTSEKKTTFLNSDIRKVQASRC